MGPGSQLRQPFGCQSPREIFSAWTMAIVFVTVAMVSFAIDEAVVLSPNAQDQGQLSPPSLLHPVQLIESLIDAALE
jgi:hypothetical protein